MKKILTSLTGIVFIIAILSVSNCSRSKRPNGSEEAGKIPTQVLPDRSDPDIFLKAIKIDGIVHLEMYDSKQDTCKVIDNLLTVVYGGNTVRWKEAKDSNIDEVLAINLIGAPSNFTISEDNMDFKTLFKLEIPEEPDPDTIKYDIVFITTWDTKADTIDPYLRIED